MKRLLLALLVGAALWPQAANAAAFGQSWIGNTVYTPGGSWQGKGKQYITGDKVSSTWQMGTDNFFTAMPPYIKSGCGGFELFTGGFAFINDPAYLTDMAQKLGQGVPFVLLDMGLNVLCEPCSKIIKDAQYLSQYLNGLQLDQCRASKIVSAKLVNGLMDKDTPASIRAESEKNLVMGTGEFELPYKAEQLWGPQGAPLKSDSETQAGCSADYKAMFVPTTDPVSVMERIAVLKNYDPSWVEIFTALVGDVHLNLTSANGKVLTNAVPYYGCTQSTPDALKDFVHGIGKKSTYAIQNTASGKEIKVTCDPITEPELQLKKWAKDQMTTIAGKLNQPPATATPLTPPEENFVKAMPYGVWAALKGAVLINETGSVIDDLAELVAYHYADLMMNDIYTMIDKGINEAELISASEQRRVNCSTELSTPVVQQLKLIQTKLVQYKTLIGVDYKRAQDTKNNIMAYGRRLEEFQKLAQERLSRTFSPNIARGVMR